MRKLPEVEKAKALMNEAMVWSVVRWLREKKRVRRTADEANAALDQLDQEVKATWTASLKSAYQELRQRGAATAAHLPSHQPSDNLDAKIRLLARKIKDEDDEAYRARMDAESTFDEAERQLSTRMAREGCHKAIRSWELHEKAIRHAESAATSTAPEA